MRLAKETNTTLHDWDARQQLYSSTTGTPLSAAESAEYAALIWDEPSGLIPSAFTHSRTHGATIPPQTSLLDFFREKVAVMFTDLEAERAREKRETLLQVVEFWGAYVGSPVGEQSLKYFWMEECIEGENPFVAGTYEGILESVARAAVAKAAIRFLSPVDRIVGRKGGEVEKPRIGVVGVETEEEFDEVVCTAPLGWLKRNKHVFTTELTPEVEKAIDSLGYGTLDKVRMKLSNDDCSLLKPVRQVYITFPSAFWEECLSTTEPIPTTAPTPSTYPGFSHWLSPKYSALNPSSWDQEAMNLAALPPPHAHPTLLFYTYGPTSAHISTLCSTSSSSSSQTPDSPSLSKALLSFFHPYFSRLPNYSPTNPSCIPSGVLATNWTADEWAGYGSYSNFKVGLEDGDGCVRALREGMKEKGIWFAGEHCSIVEASGTAAGAWLSGEGVGRGICEVGEGARGGMNGEG